MVELAFFFFFLMYDVRSVYDSLSFTKMLADYSSPSFHCVLGYPGYLRYKKLWTNFMAYLRSGRLKVTPQICCCNVVEKSWALDSETPM